MNILILRHIEIKIMDREKAMELIGQNCSDIEIKFEFYEDLVKEYFPNESILRGEEKKTCFLKLAEQFVYAGFSRLMVKEEENEYEQKYRIEGTEGEVVLNWGYLERFKSIWSDCHFLYLKISLDQFSHDRFRENDYRSRAFYVEEFNDNTAAKVASFIRNLQRWEAEWEKFDIAGIRKEHEQRIEACKRKCNELEAPIRALIRRIGLPYDIKKYDYDYYIYFQIAGRWYVRINFSAETCDDSKLQELEKFVKATDESCHRLESWNIRMRTEEENDEDHIYGDNYGWHDPKE